MASGTVLRFDDSVGDLARRIVDIPPIQQSLILKKGDTLLLTPDSLPGRLAILDHEGGRVLQPARIGVTLPEVFRDVPPGEPIWFDDGKIGGVVRDVAAEQIVVEITQARPDGEKLAGGEGHQSSGHDTAARRPDRQGRRGSGVHRRSCRPRWPTRSSARPKTFISCGAGWPSCTPSSSGSC